MDQSYYSGLVRRPKNIHCIENNESDQICTYLHCENSFSLWRTYRAHAYISQTCCTRIPYGIVHTSTQYTNSIVVVKFEHSLLPRLAVGCTIIRAFVISTCTFTFEFSFRQYHGLTSHIKKGLSRSLGLENVQYGTIAKQYTILAPL